MFENIFYQVTGLQLCSTLSYPDLYPQKGAPWFPFNGPVSASVILNKRDTYDRISFEAALMQEKVSFVFLNLRFLSLHLEYKAWTPVGKM